MQFEDFGATGNLASTLDAAVTYNNIYGMSSINIRVTVPSGATLVFEDTADGENWDTCTLRQKSDNGYTSSTTVSGTFTGSISGSRQFRVRVSVAGSGTGTVKGVINGFEI